MDEIQVNILEKSRDIFLKFGIKSVTMDDLARELGMSKKTLYQYIRDKNDLVEKVVQMEMERRQCLFQSIMDNKQDAIEEVFEVNKHVIKMLKEVSPAAGYDLRKYYPELFMKVQDSRRMHMFNAIINNINRGKKQGLYRNDLDEEIIGKINVAHLENLMRSDLIKPEEYNSDRFIRELLIYHIRGIATSKGIQVLEEKIKDFDEYIQSTK